MTTCAPSTANLGAEQLTFLLAESPARDSAEPAKGSESSTPATCGPTLSAFSKKRAPRGSSSKTWQTSHRSTIGASFCKTLRRQGMMLAGACSALETWALPIFAGASGCSPRIPEHSAWPTPRANCHTGAGGHGTGGPNLQTAVALWPTPKASGNRVSRESMTKTGHWSAPGLEQMAEISLGILPREVASLGEISSPAARMSWPTPTATDAVRCPSREATTPNVTLNHAALWATPTTRDHRSGKASAATHARNSRPLSEQVGNLLNPTWVEWLMGWPIDWTDPSGGPSSADFQEWLASNRTALTDYVRSATVRFHSVEPSPGNCSVGRSDCPLTAIPHVEPTTALAKLPKETT